MSDKNYTDIILEDINGKMSFVVEAVGQMQDEMKTLAKQSDLEEVKSDVKTVKSAVKDHSRQLKDHKQHLTVLEATD